MFPCNHCGATDVVVGHAPDCARVRAVAEDRGLLPIPPLPLNTVDLLRRIGSTVADYITPRAGAWCNFCNKPFATELDVIKTSTGVAICRTCVDNAAAVFGEREKVR